METFQEIPYVRLTATQKDKALDILRRGNRLLKKWAEFFPPKKFRQFRNLVLDGSRNPNNAIPQDRLTEFHNELPEMTAARHGVYADMDNRSVEVAVLQSFAALAKKHAKQWTIDGDPNGVTKHDYLQEAYMTIIEAMYQYTRDDIELSTFVWWALRNRMINVTNQGNLLCPFTNADLDLVNRYDKAKRAIHGHATFDQIVATLNLSEEEGKHLSTLLTKVFAENQLGGTRGEAENEDPSGNDYTGHRVGVDHESESEITLQKQTVLETLNRANLNKLERAVIEAAMEPYYGWQSDFANNHRNPETGKPYSRMRITQVLEMARVKVAKVMQAEAA